MRALALLPLLLCVGCDALVDAALGGVEFAGARAGAYCDRRYVEQGAQADSFCQEIVDTVAAAEFADDCRTKHRATAGSGSCPRSGIVAGCRLLEEHDDNSIVVDWYYSSAQLYEEIGADAGPDGGPTVKNVITSVADVQALCLDRARYEEGAALVQP